MLKGTLVKVQNRRVFRLLVVTRRVLIQLLARIHPGSRQTPSKQFSLLIVVTLQSTVTLPQVLTASIGIILAKTPLNLQFLSFPAILRSILHTLLLSGLGGSGAALLQDTVPLLLTSAPLPLRRGVSSTSSSKDATVVLEERFHLVEETLLVLHAVVVHLLDHLLAVHLVHLVEVGLEGLLRLLLLLLLDIALLLPLETGPLLLLLLLEVLACPQPDQQHHDGKDDEEEVVVHELEEGVGVGVE